jgi:SAM-dependent methyltransferase
MAESLGIGSETTLIDYGCGIGRVAKELIARHGCRVIGVDISVNMRALAIDYVRSDRFLSCSPEMLDTLVAHGFVADAAFSIWVLQHCFMPANDIRHPSISAPGGKLFVVNNFGACRPTKAGSATASTSGAARRQVLAGERWRAARRKSRAQAAGQGVLGVVQEDQPAAARCAVPALSLICNESTTICSRERE